MIYIGVDTGKKGAICFLDAENKKCHWLRIPYNEDLLDYCTLNKIMREYITDETLIWIESVNGGDNKKLWASSASFRFGANFGQIVGFLSHFGEINLVHPLTWQAHYFKRSKSITAKNQSLTTFKNYKPNIEKIIKRRHEGLIDAFLVAAYGAYIDIPFLGKGFEFIEVYDTPIA